MNRNNITLTLCALVLMLAFSGLALAEWTTEKHPLGPGWKATNGEYTINAPSEKAAKKVAKAMNKAEKKSGVMADDNGPCADPTSGVLC